MSVDSQISSSVPAVDLNSVKEVYFIGIGGIGMSALARYFKARGMKVSGYDKTKTALTTELEKEGIDIHYEDDLNGLSKTTSLVIYTPAIPKDHKELNWYKEQGFAVLKRSDVLELISAGSFNICVAGTHGKTTISTMIAHLLRDTGYGCNAFLGGISVNYETNFWSDKKNVVVIEADEYDRSFLKLSPDVAIISAMDADHLDIYENEKNMQDAFISFGDKVKSEGLLISKFGLKRTSEIKVNRKITYSLQNDVADAYASDVEMHQGGYQFTAVTPKASLPNLELKVGGMHNVENMIAAITVAVELEIEEEKIRNAVAAFRGVKRRFEYIIPPVKQKEGSYVQPVLIDDYAHHPEELRPLLKSVKASFPGRIVTVVFQPHLFSRTKDFADGFAEVLSLADNVILLPIYPARELPIEGVESELILNKMEHGSKKVIQKEQLLSWMKSHQWNKEFGEVIVMAGAGDIDALVQPVKKIIEQA